MANEEEISWPYTNLPYLGIRLKAPSGEEYPIANEKLVMIDTGFSEEILLPKDLYEDLAFNMWEEPEPEEFEIADGRVREMIVARGYILIPKIGSRSFPVRVHRFLNGEEGTNEIIIGVKFIKKFKLLLDGPAVKVRIL